MKPLLIALLLFSTQAHAIAPPTSLGTSRPGLPWGLYSLSRWTVNGIGYGQGISAVRLALGKKYAIPEDLVTQRLVIFWLPAPGLGLGRS